MWRETRRRRWSGSIGWGKKSLRNCRGVSDEFWAATSRAVNWEGCGGHCGKKGRPTGGGHCRERWADSGICAGERGIAGTIGDCWDVVDFSGEEEEGEARAV